MEESISIRLGQLARKLNLSKSEIVGIFKEIGIHIQDNSSYRVNMDDIKLLTEKINSTHTDIKVSSSTNFSKLLSRKNELKNLQRLDLETSSSLNFSSKLVDTEPISSTKDISLKKIVAYDNLKIEKFYVAYYSSLNNENETNRLLLFFNFLHKDFSTKKLDPSQINFTHILSNIQHTLGRQSNIDLANTVFQLFKQKQITKNVINKLVVKTKDTQKVNASEVLRLVQKKINKSINNKSIKKRRNSNSTSQEVINKELEEIRKIIISKSGYFKDNPSLKSKSDEELSKPKFTLTKSSEKIYSGFFKFKPQSGENEEDPLHRK